jgi:molybdopterin converting factor small subunit
MKISIQGFGLLGPMVGSQTLELDVGATVADALKVVVANVPAFAPQQSRTATAIGEALVKPETTLEDGQILVLIPPVGGG